MTEIQQSPPVPLVRNEPVEIAAGIVGDPGRRRAARPERRLRRRQAFARSSSTPGWASAAAQVVLEHARRLANGKPLILTITHFHPEHGYGAQVFAPVSTIVYNRTQLDELHEKAYPYADLFRSFGETVAAELEGFEMVEPDIVYDGEADIDLGGRIVQLRTYGGTHTKGDSVGLPAGGADPLHRRPRREQGLRDLPVLPAGRRRRERRPVDRGARDDGAARARRSSSRATATSATPAS